MSKEVEKYLETNEDLFTQNEQLNEELDDLRNQMVNMMGGAGDGVTSLALEQEKKNHTATLAKLKELQESQGAAANDKGKTNYKALLANYDKM